VDLNSVADELYALPPQDFTEVRNTRAKAAKSAGDKKLATDIAALRRPSTSAWAVNLLARERADLVEQLLELADALRTAQETLSGPELRALSTQRHRVIASVVGEARKLAAAQGAKVSDAVGRELEATFDAALADPQAAEAVSSGRLSTALSYAGLGAVPDEAGAAKPAVASPPATPKPKAGGTRERDAKRKREEVERERAEARRAAQQAVRDAERDVQTAEAERDSAVNSHQQAESARDAAQQRVADLTAQLELAQADLSAASAEVRERKRATQRAEHKAEEAHRRAERARASFS
jgi:hypothetical protein